MEKEDLLIYLLWIIYVTTAFLIQVPFGSVIAPISIILAIWRATKVKDKKKSKVLLLTSIALLLVGLAYVALLAIQSYAFLKGAL
ncbi:MAG: hypothetical protein HYW24_00035 [Candidatus Aenigmarchaeota archaeon]|nr:hypothetical protein [Candidatus Aenigmarchaeota archaeon]